MTELKSNICAVKMQHHYSGTYEHVYITELAQQDSLQTMGRENYCLLGQHKDNHDHFAQIIKS